MTQDRWIPVSMTPADAVTLVARRPIAAGEEVTVDYATHTADLPWSMTCSCGSPHCRRVVTHDDWRRPDVQARYAGHFSPFLNRRIAAGGYLIARGRCTADGTNADPELAFFNTLPGYRNRLS